VPETTSIQKKRRIERYGGKLEYHPGDYEDIYRTSIDRRFPGWNCTPGINPLSIEGAKTIAFELWEEIGVPDRVLVPCGNGTGLAGIWKGFKELRRLGKTDKLPQMIGVQLDTASPLQAAWNEKVDYVALSEVPECPIAGGILARESYTAPLALRAMQESGGFVVLVSESQIVQAQREVEQQELLVPESTSASVYAAARKLVGHLSRSDAIVCIQTAGGVKDSSMGHLDKNGGVSCWRK
jgi:threonine synthase